jgi:iron-sulfur cluster repair protein YtfE (RIC family)
MTVNEAIQRYPETLAVFNVFGIDGCCGGAIRIAEVADKHGIDPKPLFAELTRVIGKDS